MTKIEKDLNVVVGGRRNSSGIFSVYSFPRITASLYIISLSLSLIQQKDGDEIDEENEVYGDDGASFTSGFLSRFGAGNAFNL